MNNDEKVLNALECFLQKQDEYEKTGLKLQALDKERNKATSQLAKVIRSTLGHRAIVYNGVRYSVEDNLPNELKLVTEVCNDCFLTKGATDANSTEAKSTKTDKE